MRIGCGLFCNGIDPTVSRLSTIRLVVTWWRETKSGHSRVALEAGSSTSTERTGREDTGGNSSTEEIVQDRVSEVDKIGEGGGVTEMSSVGEVGMIENIVRGEFSRNVRKWGLDGGGWDHFGVLYT